MIPPLVHLKSQIVANNVARIERNIDLCQTKRWDKEYIRDDLDIIKPRPSEGVSEA